MTEHDEHYRAECAHGFYFADDHIFPNFEQAMKTLSKRPMDETNYTHTYKRILNAILTYGAGVPENPLQDNGVKTSSYPTVNAKHIIVTYQKESPRHKILNIEIKENSTLTRWPNTRY